MQTEFQRMLLGDVGDPNHGYGKCIAAWKIQERFFPSDGSVTAAKPLTVDLAMTFVDGVYVFLQTGRSITVYRGFESAGLDAPYGKDAPSYYQNLVKLRRPGRPDGLWWTPTRPSLAIDNLRMSSLHRAEPRDNAAVTREWNRLDYYLEAELPAGAFVYVGRAAPQQESAAYGGSRYGGGGFQFRLTQPPEQAFRWMRRHAAI